MPGPKDQLLLCLVSCKHPQQVRGGPLSLVHLERPRGRERTAGQVVWWWEANSHAVENLGIISPISCDCSPDTPPCDTPPSLLWPFITWNLHTTMGREALNYVRLPPPCLPEELDCALPPCYRPDFTSRIV